jgi:hypothetical protein
MKGRRVGMMSLMVEVGKGVVVIVGTVGCTPWVANGGCVGGVGTWKSDWLGVKIDCRNEDWGGVWYK